MHRGEFVSIDPAIPFKPGYGTPSRRTPVAFFVTFFNTIIEFESAVANEMSVYSPFASAIVDRDRR